MFTIAEWKKYNNEPEDPPKKEKETDKKDKKPEADKKKDAPQDKQVNSGIEKMSNKSKSEKSFMGMGK
jgi:hypothetical protein